MEEILNNVGSYIAVISPAIISIISMIISLVTTIKKVKAASSDSVAEIRKYKDLLSRTLDENSKIAKSMEETIKLFANAVDEMQMARVQIAKQNEIIATQNKELESMRKNLTTIKNQNIAKGK